MTPQQILQEYLTNDAAAFDRYNGRFVQISGVVARVERRGRQLPYVQLLLQPGEAQAMQALFHGNESQVAGLQAGDRVNLWCTPTYDGDFEMVTLNECSVVK